MTAQKKIQAPQSVGYGQDYAVWLSAQADAMRKGQLDQLDLPNLIEEIEELGRRERREVESRLEILITHLIKLSVSSAEQPRAGWRTSIREQRRRLSKLFRDSPSLRRYADDVFQSVLVEARNEAYFSLKDHEPQQAGEHEAKIRAVWDLIEIEQVLEDGAYPDAATRDSG